MERITSGGGSAMAIKADVRRPGEVRALVDTAVAAHGPIDVLVNNAGSLVERLGIREITEARLDEIVALNLKSAVFATQAVVGIDDRAPARRDRQRRVDRGPHRRHERRRRLRVLESGADGLHQGDREGTGADGHPRQRRVRPA